MLETVKQYYPEFSWARVVSDLMSPPVVWAVLAFSVAPQYSATTTAALFWASLYGIFICLIPAVFVGLMVARGSIGDIHMKRREERLRPLLVTIVSTLLVWGILKGLNAPPAFPLLALMSLVQVSFITLITLAWQISMHMVTITGAIITAGMIFSITTGLLLVPLVLLVGAARLRLKRHTPAQVLVGALVGAIVPVFLLGVIPTSLLLSL